jgi:parallel beta-helix repeat protein
MKARIRKIMALVLLALSTLDSHLATAFAQGSLTPPGSPATTMVTLSQIYSNLEARTPISSLPYAITNPGSYYLTTNLTGTANNSDGIDIYASDVTLDLNGFTLKGVVGSGSGISVLSFLSNLAIRNGAVDSWSTGVSVGLASNCTVTACNASGNSFGGIDVGNNCIVKDCNINDNEFSGIQVENNSIVTGCNANNNSGAGIVLAGNNCIVTACNANSNVLNGISVGGNNNLIAGNCCNTNGVAGISIYGGQNRIDGNHAGNNSSFGIYPYYVNTNNIIIRNSAPGNTSGAYYNTSGNNDYGPIQKPSTATSPWANF